MKKKEATPRIDVKSIKDPSFLKSLNPTQLSLLCHDLRAEIIEATSIHGGHLSANLGDVELIVALHRVFDFPKDKLIFDVGHQCYAHKILTGRSLSLLNETGGISGFQSRAESEYDPYDAGHSSTALSAAEAFAFARDLRGENFNVVALVGDASIVNGLSFEALNNIGARPNKVIAILNDNDMSITRPVGGLGSFFRKISTQKGYNKAKRGIQRALYRTSVGRGMYRVMHAFKRRVKEILVPTTMFDNMGFTYIGPVDGHNLRQLERALTRAKATSRSALIHVITVKGKGYKYAEEDKTGYWHGVTPFDVATGKPKKEHPGLITYSHLFADLTETAMETHPDSILVCPATSKGSNLEAALERFPERCIDVGIAEEHALTFAGALSINGFHPIVSIYSTFLQRAYDEISHDCSRMGANVTILIDRAGLVGKNGATHQGIYDVGFLKSIPHVTVTMPSDAKKAAFLYATSFSAGGVYGIRIPRGELIPDEPVPFVEEGFLPYEHVHESSSKKLAVLSVGPKAVELAKRVEEKNLDCLVIDPMILHPVEEKWIEALLDYENILVYDAYSTIEGYASSVAYRCAELGYKGKLIIRAIPNEFVEFDSQSSQEKKYGLHLDQIVELISSILA